MLPRRHSCRSVRLACAAFASLLACSCSKSSSPNARVDGGIDGGGNVGDGANDGANDGAVGGGWTGAFPENNGRICSQGGFCWANPTLGANVLRGIWGAAKNDVWAVGDSGTLVHWNGTAWSGVSGWPFSTAAIWGSAANDAWTGGVGNAFLHWDGTGTWKHVDGVASETNAAVRRIWGANANDVWAVTSVGSIFHWNGQQWSKASTTLAQAVGMFDVWGAAANDVWVVGEQGLLMHWNGTEWTEQPPPVATTDDIVAIWGADASHVWALSAPHDGAQTSASKLLTFNGTQWKAVAAPAGLCARDRLWGTSATDVYGIQTYEGAIAHWNGTTWTCEREPSVASEKALRDIWGASGQIWSVGGIVSYRLPQIVRKTSASWDPVADTSPMAHRPLVSLGASDAWSREFGSFYRFDGTQWNKVTDGLDATVAINAMWASGPNDVWAVGSKGTTAHWNGSGWTVVDNPAVASSVSLMSVWGVASDNVWAVGGRFLLHWNGAAWTTDKFTPSNETLVKVHGSGPGDVWAVGGTAAYHLTGGVWNAVTLPQPVSAIWTFSASNAYATTAINSDNPLLHWNGTSWAVVTGLPESPKAVFDLWASSPTSIWLAGDKGTVWHGDGSTWGVDHIGSAQQLASLTGTSDQDLWLTTYGPFIEVLRRGPLPPVAW